MIESGVINQFKQISFEIHNFRQEEKNFLKMYKVINELEQIGFVNAKFHEIVLQGDRREREFIGTALLLNKKYLPK